MLLTTDGARQLLGAKPQNEMFADIPVERLFDKGASWKRQICGERWHHRCGLAALQVCLSRASQISKEDLFYYIYGLLHSEDYKKRYADNLSKELPRIPAVKKFADFQAFSAAGRKLADLHIGYESVTPYPWRSKAVHCCFPASPMLTIG
jgi:predicted helicase